MSDVTCSQCAEPWDVHGLRHESVEYFAPDLVCEATGLGSVEDTLEFLAAAHPELGAGVAVVLVDDPDLPLQSPLTLDGLYRFCVGVDRPEGDRAMAAARLLFGTAVYRAVLRGEGCPSCGFAHVKVGPHRGTTLRELMFGGVTEHDLVLFLRPEDVSVGLSA